MLSAKNPIPTANSDVGAPILTNYYPASAHTVSTANAAAAQSWLFFMTLPYFSIQTSYWLNVSRNVSHGLTLFL